MRKPTAHEIAAEIIRRANGSQSSGSHIIRLSEPPAVNEGMQLLAARLERRAIVVVPHKCHSAQEWVARYAQPKGR